MSLTRNRPSLPEDKRNIYLIGQKAIEEEMQEIGLVWHGGTVSNVLHLAQTPLKFPPLLPLR